MQRIMKGTVTSTATLLLIIAASLWGISQANEDSMATQDCCLTTSPSKIPLKILHSYRIQLPSDGCKIHAVVFRTKKNRQLCSPPQEKWVKKLTKKLDMKKTKPSQKRRSMRHRLGR
ncbi:C-C motif chemokine 19-like [Chiloscyllium plagiosum]|uniref:C-C motif chemokine 19-like n=1 Tax=Chiloscyllium plagiosum TaxID=36176 RepID=UPI001CB7D931|nr:C-C motif chemokine 19-like [Chiloscyllium plagiosum]